MLALTQAPSGAVAFNLKPNASLKTIQIRHGSSFRFREERRTVAFAMVLRRDAQNVRERFYPGKDSDAFARTCLGRHRNGSDNWPQTTCLAALHSARENPRRGARRLSFLNRCQFCRRQKASLSDDKLQAVLGDDRTSFNDTERLVIELADAMTDTPANVSDDLYARLQNQFSEEQLMQLGAQIAFKNYRPRWNRTFDVESDNLYAPQPGQSQESR